MSALSQAKYTLKYVQSISRHGARTTGYPQIRLFKNQPLSVPHQLTEVGARQHFLLGYEFYRRYNSKTGSIGKLYDEYYNPKEVMLMSTSKQRTLSSARAQVKGLFSFQNKARGRHFLEFAQNYESFHQIPIVAYNVETDPFRSDWCPKAEEMEKQLKKGDLYDKLEQKYRVSLFPALAQLLGTSPDKLTLSYVNHVRDVLETLDADGFDIGRFKSLLSQLKDLHFDYKLLVLTADEQSLKAKVTNYLRATASYFTRALTSQFKRMQLFFYHDTNLVELAKALGIDMKNRVPPYASTIVFELWEDQQVKSSCQDQISCLDAYSVKTLYNDEVVLQDHQRINQIGAIPLKEWIEFINSITMENQQLKDYCGLDNDAFKELSFLWKMIL